MLYIWIVNHCNFSIISVGMVLAHRFTLKSKSFFVRNIYEPHLSYFVLPQWYCSIILLTHPSLKTVSLNDFTSLACSWDLSINLWWTRIYNKRKSYWLFSFLRFFHPLHCLVDFSECSTSDWLSGVKIRLQVWLWKIWNNETGRADGDLTAALSRKGNFFFCSFSGSAMQGLCQHKLAASLSGLAFERYLYFLSERCTHVYLRSWR